MDDYKKCTTKYVERSALFYPITDSEKTLNQVILNKVKKGCSFFYKCLTYHKRQSFNWNKQKAQLEIILGKSYEDAEWIKWFEFLANAVYTAKERNWSEIRYFLVPRDLNRVNFC